MQAALERLRSELARSTQGGGEKYVKRHVARGKLTVNGQPLEAGDALKAADTAEVVLEKGEGAEVLLFDLA